MNALVELNLALILFLPWYAILAVLFWVYPRAPRPRGRRLFDATALGVATLATTLSLHWSFAAAGIAHGGMWRQVLATSVSYGVFLAAMTTAWFVRRRLLTAFPTEIDP
jgi:hypothetical protein